MTTSPAALPALMAGKKGLIMGVATERSIGWGIAQVAAAHGAELAFSYQGDALEKRVRPLAASIGSDFLVQCDVGNDEALDATFARFQQSSGKYNYWDGNYYHFWSDIYAGNFLVEMKRLNQLPKNSEMLQKWINVHTTSANNWALSEASSEYVYESESIAQAFRLFVLAKGGSPAKSAMNRFVSSNKSKNPLTWWLLAGSFQLSGYESKAKEFMAKAELLQINNDNSRDYDTFGDEGRDLAIIVEVLSHLNVDKSKSEKYYDQMVNVLNKQSWVSTQTKGFAFIGAFKYFGKSLNVTNKVDYTITGLSGGTKTYNHSAFEPKVIVIDKSSMGKNLRNPKIKEKARFTFIIHNDTSITILIKPAKQKI